MKIEIIKKRSLTFTYLGEVYGFSFPLFLLSKRKVKILCLKKVIGITEIQNRSNGTSDRYCKVCLFSKEFDVCISPTKAFCINDDLSVSVEFYFQENADFIVCFQGVRIGRGRHIIAFFRRKLILSIDDKYDEFFNEIIALLASMFCVRIIDSFTGSPFDRHNRS